MANGDDEKRYTGHVLWYDHRRGFGFAECAAAGVDIFIHGSEFKKNENERALHVRKNQRLSFALEQKKKGLAARNIRMVPMSEVHNI